HARYRDSYVPQVLGIGVHLAVVAPVVALVAELQAVRAGDVRTGESPVGPAGLVVEPALRSIPDGRGDVGRDQLCEVQRLNQVLGRVRIELAAAPLIVGAAES